MDTKVSWPLPVRGSTIAHGRQRTEVTASRVASSDAKASNEYPGASFAFSLFCSVEGTANGAPHGAASSMAAPVTRHS